MTTPSAPVRSETGSAPLSMGRVALTVNDLDRVGDFYQRVVGLHRLGGDGESALLGAGGTVLLELRSDKAARRRSPREAGLFHTAFLLPERADLGQWTKNAMATRAPVIGASDHGVSEALYLSDPEGNGIEIYADRPVSAWKRAGGQIEMPSDPLDVGDLVASVGDGVWTGFPEGSVIGHVHLQVGAIAEAEAFYAGILGFDITCRYPGGSFYAADGYHHHIATNIWNSRGAPARSYPSTGLAEVAMEVNPARLEAARNRAAAAEAGQGTLALRDPWGTAITLRMSGKD
ncbi:VOC family protein [Xinfangfangia sp. D13-10-4-6]|uniref:VOC family protein n=1 Tax=Pseudogemmobacter hezensis TaxID=2737662 RepID=UPI0015532508|nr:VOC family protein [Pseudogemmobacter hezensis]NPD14976.1 VOC family protein [Pseudogemmobacter hezensis]